MVQYLHFRILEFPLNLEILHVFPEDSRKSCSKMFQVGRRDCGAHLGAGAEALTSPPVEKEVGPGLMAWMINDLES